MSHLSVRSTPLRLTATALAAAVALTACSGSSGGDPKRTTRPSHKDRPTPTATRTITKSVHRVDIGTPVELVAQQGVAVRITADKPSVSTTRLSSSYGYPPANGYYVTFEMTIQNTGRRAVILGPHNFYVTIPTQGQVTTYDGNAAYSGSDHQLDTTEIEVGQRLRAPLTFDVRQTHGQLVFHTRQGRPTIFWSF